MTQLSATLPARHRVSATVLLTVLFMLLQLGQPAQTKLLILASLLMFGFSWFSAAHLLGFRPALRFALIAVTVGWAAEQMGSSHGWFFGDYDYTTVLGPTLADVPIVIPLMWFALTFGAYVIANLIAWQTPVAPAAGIGWAIALSFLAALIVTAWDLGADPYFVFTLKAWIMVKKDGWWFGETLQGFFGWMFVSFVIVLAFRLTAARPAAVGPTLRTTRLAVWVPLLIYGGCMVFQMVVGDPVELRTIAFFAIGIPLFAALCGLARWQSPTTGKE